MKNRHFTQVGFDIRSMDFPGTSKNLYDISYEYIYFLNTIRKKALETLEPPAFSRKIHGKSLYKQNMQVYTKICI